MVVQSKDLFEKLEFDKIISLLKDQCSGDLGRGFFSALTLQTDLESLELQLKKVKDLKLCLDKKDTFPFREYEDLTADLRMLAVDGYVLSIESLQKVNHTLLNFRDIYRFFTPVRKEIYPFLYSILKGVALDEALSGAILRVINEHGEIRSDASPELVNIRKAMQSKARELDKVYRSMINDYRNKGWLTDSVESFRNGRRVLSVPSEHKRKIRGIIHDESTTGKTAFIEPEEAIEINNDIFDLETEERQEIYRILRDLSAFLRPHAAVFELYQSVIVQFDVVLAKARLALRMKANMPKMVDAPHFGFRNARHPLLYLKNREAGKETVPFNFSLLHDNRILMLSGPNAGGKSITMKAVGLIQVMLQAGLLVPVHELSEMGVFHSIFAQIGDAQSIEDELSTYSAQLTNMKYFVGQVDERSLVLIDEFGTGTDPKIGGAIAEGVLRELNKKKCYAFITTHFSNLKMFSYKTEGIVNAAMNFDKDTLSPTYQMTIGRPGSSYAFEIAQKVGLPKSVIDYAKNRVGENEKAVDELLVDLQNEKQEVEAKLIDMTEKQKLLDKLIRQYDDQVKEVELRRKKMKLDVKEALLQNTAKDNKEVEELMRNLRQEKNLEKAQEYKQQLKQTYSNLAQEVTQLSEDIYYQPKQTKKEIEAGDFVKLRTGGATGKVETVEKNEAVILMGEMKMKIKVKDLQLANEPIQIQIRKSINTDAVRMTAEFDSNLDVRGMNLQDAMRTLENYLDSAMLTSATSLRIVHGKGNGILRKLVKNKLKEYRSVTRSWHPENNEGGDGVTLVEMAD